LSNFTKETTVLRGAFPLGPFIVEDSGRLTFRAPERAASFSFAWRNRRFAAEITEGTVSLRAAPTDPPGAQPR
jgi:hypothetical protein